MNMDMDTDVDKVTEYGLRMTRTPGEDMYTDTRYRVLNLSKPRPFSGSAR